MQPAHRGESAACKAGNPSFSFNCMDFAWLCLYLLAVRFACGVVSGATAIGGVMLSMPLLMAVFTPVEAVLLSTVMGVFSVPQMAWLYHRYCTYRDVFCLALGCLPGCLLGAFILTVAPMRVLQLMICALLFCFIALQYLRRFASWRLPDSLSAGIVAGAVCGFVSASVAMAGAPLGIYVLLKHWDPDRARGNMSMFYVFTVGGSVLSQAGAGLYKPELLKLAIVGVAGNLLGQFLGYRLGKRVNHQVFRRIITGFLAVAACVLLWRAMF